MELSIEELKSENLKLKLENKSLVEQIGNLKNTVFRKDLLELIDKLDIPIGKIDDDEFIGYLRIIYDKAGVGGMEIKLREMLGIEDEPPSDKSFDIPDDVLKYMEKVSQTRLKNKISI